MDPSSQVHTILLNYLYYVQNKQMNTVEVVQFIFNLALTEFNQVCFSNINDLVLPS